MGTPRTADRGPGGQRVWVGALVLLAGLLSGCAGSPDAPSGKASTAPTSAASSTDAASAEPTSAGSSTGTDPGATTEATPETAPLSWAPAGPLRATVTADGDTTISISGGAAHLTIDGAQVPLPKPGGYAAAEALLDRDYAVIVHQEKTESLPGSATVIERASGKLVLVDGQSDPPTVNGGPWALGRGAEGHALLFHATFGAKNAYCLAAQDLVTDTGRVVWCAPKATGFNSVRQTPAGLTVLSFTAGRPSCRTPLQIDLASGTAEPVPGPTACAGWDSLLTDAGPVWSSVPDENQIEEADFFAATADGTVSLGVGDTGSLTWCGGSAYFTRQPQADGEPAELLRWDGAGLESVYQSPGSPGFLSAPRCGGDAITITARSEGGDEQVTARLP